jgi:hypothetical protein
LVDIYLFEDVYEHVEEIHLGMMEENLLAWLLQSCAQNFPHQSWPQKIRWSHQHQPTTTDLMATGALTRDCQEESQRARR